MLRELTYEPQVWKKPTEDFLQPGTLIWAVAALDITDPGAFLYEEFATWEQALACALSMNYAGL